MITWGNDGDDKRGEHLGEFDIDMNQTKPPEKSGKYNLRES